MSKQYTIISNDEGKWLQPIDVPYPNEDDQEEESIFQLADAVLYKQRCEPLPYIGSKQAGTVVDESEVREVRQWQGASGTWWDCGDSSPLEEAAINNSETRIVYTDSEPDYYPGSDYQPLFDHMKDEHGLTLIDSEMDEIIRICKKIES